MVCTHEKGMQIRNNVKDLVGLELSPALYPMLFNKLKNSISRFFDAQGPVSVYSISLGQEFTFSFVSCALGFCLSGANQRDKHTVCGADHRHNEEPVRQPHRR